MTNERFMEILRYIRLPRGTLLNDGTTYRLEKDDFPPRKFKKELEGFEKILVLSDGNGRVVGGVLFYDNVDIHVTTLPKYWSHGYMSAIHKNGILAEECYPNQKVSIVCKELESIEDFLLRNHMLKMAGLRAKNLLEVYERLNFINQVDGYDEESFLREFS